MRMTATPRRQPPGPPARARLRRAVGAAAALALALLAACVGGGVDVAPEVAARDVALLERDLAALEPQRPGVVDLYFVGFAPEGTQDVFWREMDSVRALMDERFDTRGRSLVLANGAEKRGRLPPATVANLERALRTVGRRMDPAEDVLFLFASSHGSPDHRLAAHLPGGGRLEELRPARLAEMLRASGAAWRVVVVSACFSGGYLAPLRDAGILVVTAAHRDRTSFGCSTGNAFTYFGEAYFDHALRRETISFVRAYELAAAEVRARERREGLTPSEPQIAQGALITERLEELERRLGATP